jgi:hypothetical protein
VAIVLGGVGAVVWDIGEGGGVKRIGDVIISETVDAGIDAPNTRRSFSAWARTAIASVSASSLLTLVGNASSRALAFLRVPSPLRIVDSSFAFSAANRPRNALS